VRAFYQPHAIATYRAHGRIFLATANKGDRRDFDSIYTERARVRDLRLDPLAFPNASFLTEEENLGRLEVSRIDGVDTRTGMHRTLYAFGGRSFAIWSETGKLIFDSGSQFEQITAELTRNFPLTLGNLFNSPDNETKIDDQSDTRGPEPEGLAVGMAYGRHYAFITLLRPGGLMVYDITDPVAPQFQQYINTRNFAVSGREVCSQASDIESPECAAAGDTGPEHVVFIPEAESPMGLPLVLVGNETSGSVALFSVNRSSNR
jgi:2',3'-cyclic-nucleotide 2'-phosphodiesterase / 3'-nucleotidase / 5'-nucleotidase